MSTYADMQVPTLVVHTDQPSSQNVHSQNAVVNSDGFMCADLS